MTDDQMRILNPAATLSFVVLQTPKLSTTARASDVVIVKVELCWDSRDAWPFLA